MSTPECQNNSNADTNGSNGTNDKESKVPKYLEAKLFEQLLKDTVPEYQSIETFKAYPAMSAGENYATIMLRVEIEVELKGDKSKTVTYMLKIPQENDFFELMMKNYDIFSIEVSMYLDVVPEFEKMYQDAGVEVKFGAKCYQLPTPTKTTNVLLEDLKPKGFKNANRLEGLDIEHTKCVLKKLAQWHAASATRVQLKGAYPKLLMKGPYSEETTEIIDQVNNSMSKPFTKCMKNYKGHELYEEAVTKVQTKLTDFMLKLGNYDTNEFNVLNHGDCWTNNIMFQYDDFGKIKETYLVDYQIPRFCSPANDLIYFLLSSPAYDIKLQQFDYFIKYYHDNLVESLKLLKYPKNIPTLKEIHMMLYKYGTWGFATVISVMAAVLLDPNENANLDNFLSDSDTGTDFKLLMYSNPRYKKHAEAILPWLLNRGALEC